MRLLSHPVTVAAGVCALFLLGGTAGGEQPVRRDAQGLPTDTVSTAKKAAPAPVKKKQPARSKATPAPARPQSRDYVPDQPWETEFYVSNTVPESGTRSFFRLASVDHF